MRQPAGIAVIGLGHVGLPTALSLAEAGWPVVGTDSDADRVAMIADGRAPFYEPGLDNLLRRHLATGRFCATSSLSDAVHGADVLFVCVSTPQLPDGAADLTHVEAVARTIATHLNGNKLIVEKSTTPVQTAERIKQTLRRYRDTAFECEVAVNPEFLQEGKAVHDVLHPDRIVVGAESEQARTTLADLYRPLLARLPKPGECATCDAIGNHEPPEARLLLTNLATAELIKHTANAFLATKISFINMIADVCEATGADVTQVAHGIGLDPRIGPHFLRAGIGFGGSCLPKDLRAFVQIAEAHRVDVSLLHAARAINERRVDRLWEKLVRALWIIKDKTVAVLGLAFKPETDDIREAPSLRLLERLLEEGAYVRAYDPQAMEAVRGQFPGSPGLTLLASPYEAAEGAHALVLVTEWDEFRMLDLARLRRGMALPVLVDGRNLFDPDAAREAGFEYVAIGRGASQLQ